MSSNSETSYGARIGNAEKLVAALLNYNGYVAVKPEYRTTSYSALIAAIKNQNKEAQLRNSKSFYID